METEKFVEFLNYTFADETASLVIAHSDDEMLSYQTALENNRYTLIANIDEFLHTITNKGKYYILINESNITPLYSLVKQFAGGQIYDLFTGDAIIPDKEGSLVLIISKDAMLQFENEHAVSYRSICGLTYQTT